MMTVYNFLIFNISQIFCSSSHFPDGGRVQTALVESLQLAQLTALTQPKDQI